MSSEYTVEAFIGDVKEILARDGTGQAGLEQIADRMGQLIANPEVTTVPGDVAGNVHTGQQSGPVYTDETGLTLVRARFGPEEMTPIHSHGSWGVIGVYQGRDQYQVWRRSDGGDGPGQASVELVEERILEPGDVVILPPPPQDIHAQRGYDGEAAYEFVLFGENVMELPRLYFNVEENVAEKVRPSR